jgi:hypothetical protein
LRLEIRVTRLEAGVLRVEVRVLGLILRVLVLRKIIECFFRRRVIKVERGLVDGGNLLYSCRCDLKCRSFRG